jgi:MYXO-CTERM domain-containing protein
MLLGSLAAQHNPFREEITMRTRIRLVRALAAVAALGGASLLSSPASACGGFFCQNIPVDQSGEEILFGVNPDTGRVRATIRIFYQGDAQDFAWVLPLPNVPEISTGSDMVFDRLKSLTSPRFELEWPNDECNFGNRWLEDGDLAGGGEGGDDGGAPSEGGVQVIDSGQVGAFEYAILSSSSAEELVTWLNDNDFDQPPTSTPLIESYVEQEMIFVALKMQKDASSGDITPVVLDFAEEAPCVPLVLTQIAATPDMPVTVWVASDARVVPNNWFEVQPNLKKINWLEGGWNYVELVTAAVNEAAGRAFVTDYAGPTSIAANGIYSEGQYDVAALQAATDPIAFIDQLRMQFGFGNSTLLSILRKHMPVPPAARSQGITEQDFYNCPECYSEFYAQLDFDSMAAAQDVEDRIVTPLREAQEMIDGYSTLTRLFTTVSANEMTRDPIFSLNADLPEVPLVRKAIATAECDNNQITNLEITLPDGAIFNPEIPSWWGPAPSYEADDVASEPNAGTILINPSKGEPFPIESEDVEYADNQLNSVSAELVIEALGGPAAPGNNGEGGGNTDEGGNGGGGSGSSSGGDGCSHGAGPASWMGLLFAGAFLARRRRK